MKAALCRTDDSVKPVHNIRYEYEERVLAYRSGATTHCFRRGISQCYSRTTADLGRGQVLSFPGETTQEVANYVISFSLCFALLWLHFREFPPPHCWSYEPPPLLRVGHVRHPQKSHRQRCQCLPLLSWNSRATLWRIFEDLLSPLGCAASLWRTFQKQYWERTNYDSYSAWVSFLLPKVCPGGSSRQREQCWSVGRRRCPDQWKCLPLGGCGYWGARWRTSVKWAWRRHNLRQWWGLRCYNCAWCWTQWWSCEKRRGMVFNALLKHKTREVD